MLMKKYNSKSKYFKNWTTKKLKEEARGYHETIYKVECYGTRDMMAYSGILKELENRGVRVDTELSFSNDNI